MARRNAKPLPAGLTPGCRVVLKACGGEPEEPGYLLSDEVVNGSVIVQVWAGNNADDGLRECPVEMVAPEGAE
jgi:hypothetical protein